MIQYGNFSGKSGILGYDIGDNYIIVTFDSGSSYTYSYLSAGEENVNEMKELARSGQGLHSYINNYAKDSYE